MVLAPDVQFDEMMLLSVDVLANDLAFYPGNVAVIVELPELVGNLPKPGVVTHPVGDELA